MKFQLRNFAVAAALVASVAAFAENPTVTMKWRHTIAPNAEDIRGGNAYGGEVYFEDGTNHAIKAVGADGQVRVVYQHDAAMNRGFTMDDAGNIMIQPAWPTSAATQYNFLLIPAGSTEATPVTIALPSEFAANRGDMLGRAVGDFMSYEGGLFFLTATGMTFPAPVWMAEGVQVNGEDGVVGGFDPAMPVAAASQCYAIPSIESMDEFDEELMHKQFYWHVYNNTAAEIYYIDENNGAALLNKPTLPDGYGFRQNGFEVFTLGGERYVALKADKGGNWTSNFVIANEATGEVIFTSDNGEAPSAFNDTKTGNGGLLVARKVSDYKVELYQIYASGDKTKIFGAMYEVTIPEPIQPELPLYIAGQFQGWDFGSPAEFTLADGLYTYEFNQTGGGFKISTTKGESAGDWAAFNAGGLTVAEGSLALEPGNTYALAENSDAGDFMLPNGKYTLTVDLAAKTLKVEGEVEAFVAPVLNLRGDFNGWGTTAFETTGEIVNDEVTYTLHLDAIQGGFKLAYDDWANSFGGPEIEGAGEYVMSKTNNNNAKFVKELKNVTLTAVMPAVTGAAEIKLIVEVVAPKPERKAFAYNLKAEDAGDAYNVTFDVAGKALAAAVVVTPVGGGEAISFPVAEVAATGNAIAIAKSDLSNEVSYNWAVEIASVENQVAGIVYEDPYADVTRGSVVTITDPAQASFGYTVVAHGKNAGIDIFNPAGEKVADKIFAGHAMFGGAGNTNQSDPFRGNEYEGKAVLATWGDKGYGAVVVDPINTEAEPFTLFAGEKQASGNFVYNETSLGGGTAGISFMKDDEGEAYMFSFSEDHAAETSNSIVRYHLSSPWQITEAPVVLGYKALLLNTNVDLVTYGNGVFASQVRGAGNNIAGCPCFAYISDVLGDHFMAMTSADEGVGEYIDNSTSGIAVSADGKLFAADLRGKVVIFDLATDEYGDPKLTYRSEFEVADHDWAHIRFDAAGNLHAYYRQGGYRVFALAEEAPKALTAAPADNVFLGTGTAVEGIAVDAAAPVEYYNLQGVRVNAENLTPGIYVRRQGKVATKVIVK